VLSCILLARAFSQTARRTPTMQSPEWLKPALYGAACGAIALATVGFSWGGWVTGGESGAGG
jgi:hypothetical protein